ncbi:MAG: glutamine--fructose-6-phosphate transaminase (isomerizing) [Gammaproteobacteria bacterium]|nr:glutamine--fructose-6-phosphate transaminase (isomerizing) [Gammaproteobacteria bacterium]|tara:strand:- start:22 stop:1854 length:1833 start_codon:yes stop_codon:yes gene_type:complete
MCGIVGIASEDRAADKLLTGLFRQEYRGYDSSGLAVFGKDSNQVQVVKRKGKVSELQNATLESPMMGNTGIAHTRWATHGIPSESNAHPHHSNEEVYIVHNGIIENHQELRTTLKALGYDFKSETDTEVIAHLIHAKLEESNSLVEATKEAVKDLEGAYAIGAIHIKEPQVVVGARRGSPLVLGLGRGENLIASDQLAIADYAESFVFLEDGDLAEITPEETKLWDQTGKEVERPIIVEKALGETIEKGEYRHFMLKEIFEQPDKIKGLLEAQLTDSGVQQEIFGPKAPEVFEKVEAIQIVACGTSYHAGLVARYWLEGLAGLPCSVEVASEFRYRNKVVAPNTLFVSISQSGETADTLACLRYSKDSGYLAQLGICNVPTSSLARESDLVFLTKAGPEIGVASTKAFTTQLIGLLMLTLVIGRRHGLSQVAENSINESLRALPDSLDAVMKLEPSIVKMAEHFDQKEHALFLGRGIHYPIAMEGALKLKEISYIHAEAYPAGELKHGPLALIDSEMPVIAVAPNDDLLEKLKSNLQEVKARGGELYVFGHSHESHEDTVTKFIELPEIPELIAPIIYTIPLQLLSYHVAILKGTDIDQPRNLAKSVTVE